ncbi:MAG TPA: hemolysin family protein [Thermoanaerobaculia bacterium]
MLRTILLEIVVIALLVVANGVFAMSEIAVVSARKARLLHQARRGDGGAARALRLSENPDRFLSTVQIGITLIGVFAGAFGGATIASQLDARLETIPGLAPYSEAIGVGAVVLFITYVSLIIGELVPKRIALNAPERIAAMVAPGMHLLSTVAAPAVAFLGFSTRVVMRVLRVPPKTDTPVTTEELRVLLHQGVAGGTIGDQERQILDRALRLARRPVRAVMTPRVDVEWLDLTRPIAELREKANRSPHHRFPVAVEQVDQIRGIVSLKDLLRADVRSTADLQNYVREPVVFSENGSTLTLLQRFQQSRKYLAVIIDEFGGVEGIVTPNDILEALVGQLPETGDSDQPLFVRQADGSWSIDAAADLDDVESMTGFSPLPARKDEFQTIAGYVVNLAGRIPRAGEVVDTDDYQFEILKGGPRRIDRIVMRKMRDEETSRA